MKKFDTAGILQRFLDRLSLTTYWSSIPKDGPNYEMAKAYAEVMNESARYMEFMYGEKKWNHIKTFEALESQARLSGYKLSRKTSAFGTLVVSHPDPTGVQRLPNLGEYFLNLDEPSDYDSSSTATTNAATLLTKTLVPFYHSSTATEQGYTVPLGTEFTSTDGQTYTSIEAVTVKDKTALTSSEDLSQSKYGIIKVVEGEAIEVTLGTSTGAANQTFTVLTDSIEAGRSQLSKDFLYIEIFDSDGNQIGDKWHETNYLTDEAADACKFEISCEEGGSSEVIFGDGLNGKIPDTGATIVFHYLETSGLDGNLSKKYAMNMSSYTCVDGADIGVDINVQNTSYLLGGSDFETLEEAKRNAEIYARSVDITNQNLYTIADYFKKNCSVPLAAMNLKKGTTDFYQNTTNALNKIFMTGIGVDGRKLDTSSCKSLISQANLLGETEVISSPYFVWKDPQICALGFAASVKESTITQDKAREDAVQQMEAYIMKEFSYLARDFNSTLSLAQLQHKIAELTSQDNSIETSFYIDLEPTGYEIQSGDSPTYILLNFDITPYITAAGIKFEKMLDLDFSKSIGGGVSVKNTDTEKTYFFYASSGRLKPSVISTKTVVSSQYTAYFQKTVPLVYKAGIDLSNLIYHPSVQAYIYATIPYYVGYDSFVVALPLSDFGITYSKVEGSGNTKVNNILNTVKAADIKLKLKILPSSFATGDWNTIAYLAEQDIYFE